MPRQLPLSPRFAQNASGLALREFPQADPKRTTQMKSVGEAMAIGRTFKESLQKCLRSLELGRCGLGRGKLSVRRGYKFTSRAPAARASFAACVASS